MAKASKSAYLKNTYICLLAGGSGTRLWPRSRKQTPKQFTPILSRQTLFQETIARAKKIVPPERIFVAANKDYIDDVRRQSPEIPRQNIIGEPQKKNTAMAMGTAAAFIHKRNPKAVVINLATDHKITNLPLYFKTLKAAAQTAFDTQKIVSVGVVPTFAHTGLGYIKTGKKIDKINGIEVLAMEGFKEKPDLATAKKFFNSGKYLWNTNNFVYPAGVLLEEFEALAPDIYHHISKVKKAAFTLRQKAVLRREFSQVRSEAIDYAIAEKTKRMVLIPGKFGWDDIGDWKAVYDISKKDKDDNVVIQGDDEGDYYNLNSEGNLIHFDDQLIVTIGVKDLLIVDTDDALVVCRKDKAQDVKKVVQYLKEKNKKKYL